MMFCSKLDAFKEVQITTNASNTVIDRGTEPGEQKIARSFHRSNPGHMDVICARGKHALEHPGNKRFRALISARLEEYAKATSKMEKSRIVTSIIDAVRPEGSFVKEKAGKWFEVGDHVAREKIGQW